MSKLLIVDDELDIREFAGNFFKKRGIDVHKASGGQEALELAEKERPDLILLDVRMEDMTGVEVLRKLRQGNNNVNVIMVSGVENGDIIKEVQDLGILGYVHKPLVLSELESIVLRELEKIA